MVFLFFHFLCCVSNDLQICEKSDELRFSLTFPPSRGDPIVLFFSIKPLNSREILLFFVVTYFSLQILRKFVPFSSVSFSFYRYYNQYGSWLVYVAKIFLQNSPTTQCTVEQVLTITLMQKDKLLFPVFYLLHQ